jgi:hypothetical protein
MNSKRKSRLITDYILLEEDHDVEANSPAEAISLITTFSKAQLVDIAVDLEKRLYELEKKLDTSNKD